MSRMIDCAASVTNVVSAVSCGFSIESDRPEIKELVDEAIREGYIKQESVWVVTDAGEELLNRLRQR
jgi:hypothetical protein